MKTQKHYEAPAMEEIMVLTEQGFATSPTAPWTDGTLDDGFNDMGEL